MAGSFDDIAPPKKNQKAGSFDDIAPSKKKIDPPAGSRAIPKAVLNDPEISGWDVPGMAIRGSAHDALQFGKSVANTYMHPYDAYQALMKGPGGVPDMRPLVPAATAAVGNVAGGVALNTLTPKVRAMVVKQHPTLKPAAGAGSALTDYASSSYGNPKAIKNSLAKHPIRTLADVSTFLTAPSMVMGATGVAARLAGRLAGTGAIGRTAGTVERAANTVSRAIELPTQVGDVLNPINFIPDIPGNLIAGAGYATRGLGAERIGNFISATGNAIKPTKALGNATALWARNAMRPENRVFLDAAGDQAQDVADALAAAQHPLPGTSARAGQIVPGTTSTGPEAVAHVVNAPRLQVLGQEAKKNQDQMTNAMNRQNDAARVAHVQNNVSGTPAQRQAALDAQQADRARYYGASDATTFKIDPELHAVMMAPEGQDAIRQINTNRANRSLPPLGWNVGDTMDGVTVHQFKKQLDDAMFRATGAAKPDSDNIRAINDLNDLFLKLIDRPGFNPMYNHSRRIDAAHHRGIDQQNTGAYMESLANNPTAFDNALDNAANAQTRNPSIPSATGHSIYGHHADYMEPAQTNAFIDVSADHARRAEAAKQARLPSDRDGLDNAFESIQLPNVLGVKGHAAAKVYNSMIKGLNPEVASSVSRSLMTPEGTLALANEALRQQGAIATRTGDINRVGEYMRNAFIRNPTIHNVREHRQNKIDEKKKKRNKN